jgi:hypothetical protein
MASASCSDPQRRHASAPVASLSPSVAASTYARQLNGVGLLAGFTGAVLLGIAEGKVIRRASGAWGGWDDEAMKQDPAVSRARRISTIGWILIALAFLSQFAALFLD